MKSLWKDPKMYIAWAYILGLPIAVCIIVWNKIKAN